ncbi:hypothetical protein TNCV_4701951 [Trichonephila clavipes]|uniref:Uncharacterized protein n=1 Tax=Trichonephila clavipes TaxID=2585209 RepID=A0A8X7BLJ9_TRICX|nr:hypothetical protein TNCV_4701951 [Trichonephila clavipes]
MKVMIEYWVVNIETLRSTALVGSESSQAKNVSASALRRQHVAKFCHSFQSGRQDVESRNMTGNWSSSSTTEITTARIGEMIQKDRRVTLPEIFSEVGLNYGSLEHIVSDVLRFPKTVL